MPCVASGEAEAAVSDVEAGSISAGVASAIDGDAVSARTENIKPKHKSSASTKEQKDRCHVRFIKSPLSRKCRSYFTRNDLLIQQPPKAPLL